MTRQLALALGMGLMMALFIVLGLPGKPVQIVPTIPASLLPGQIPPPGLVCSFYEPDPAWRDCQSNSGIDLEIQDGRIQHSYVFTYTSGLRVGDVLAVWGTPQGADYSGWGSVELAWAAKGRLDHWLYALTDGAFSPLSRVGFVAFGPLDNITGPWRGFCQARCDP